MKIVILSLLLLALPALADPCGMVPPISLDGEDANIERVGEQKTYVFYKDGMETIVIHPGFRGSVDEFGMLIPFPKVPALRKVPDDTFAQLEKTLDPPVISYWVNNMRFRPGVAQKAGGLMLESAAAPADRDQVVVLKEEAVGMYEIAVLEAGSAAALKRWMVEHGYKFPEGMEPTCNEYVDDKWCFVAVKTRVGSKAGVDPRPGMRTTSPDKPKEAVFSGKVQAMGFRFHSEKLVVPMRLSTFNEGDLNNTLYVLADEPLRASNLPVELVKRQITGDKLLANLTQPLPYKIEGGTEDDMSPNDWTQLNGQRDPVPYNGIAGELFASDLLAGNLGQLSHGYEEREKALLDIGERLGLRGGQIDALHSAELATDREEVKSQALDQLKGMTLTLIEGEFPRDVLANQNLLFAPFKLDSIEGLAAAPTEFQPMTDIRGGYTVIALSIGLLFGLILYKLFLESFVRLNPAQRLADCVTHRLRSGAMRALRSLPASRWTRFHLDKTFEKQFSFRGQQLALTLIGLVILGSPQVQAQDSIKTTVDWINLLDVPDRSKEAIKKLESSGRAAYPYLIARYKNEKSPVTERGYCLALLTKAPDNNVQAAVWEVASATDSPLVKLWSQAALVQLTKSPDQLLTLLDAEYAKSHGDPDKDHAVLPVSEELQRPIALKLKEWGPQLTLEQQLRFLGIANSSGQAAQVSPNISSVVSPLLRSAKVPELVQLMFHSDSQEVRRLSAALLAGFQDEKRKAVFSSVMEELSINQASTEVPWSGGALFLPQFSNMNKSEAQELITGLTRWSVWTDLHKTDQAQIQPLENNLRSYSLWTAAGGSEDWRNATGGRAWLQAYGKLMGAKAVDSLLQEQGVPKSSSLWEVVKLVR